MPSDAENWYSDETATLGDRIAAAREGAGLTQAELATRLGVRKTTLEAWENDRREPRANRLQLLTGMLGVSLRWLLTGIGEGPELDESGAHVPADVQALLVEMRALQVQMSRAALRLGVIEKKLRTAVGTS